MRAMQGAMHNVLFKSPPIHSLTVAQTSLSFKKPGAVLMVLNCLRAWTLLKMLLSNQGLLGDLLGLQSKAAALRSLTCVR